MQLAHSMLVCMQALKKTALGQVTIFPTYVTLFYAYIALLEGKSARQACGRVQRNFWPTMATGTVFWPIANMLNFTLVPQRHRVLYVGVMGIAWNSFLSWQNSREISVDMQGM